MKTLLTNASLALRTAADHWGDDPVVLALQISRRLPARLTHLLARLVQAVPGRRASARAVVAAVVLGEETKARALLQAALQEKRTTSARARRLADVAIAIGEPGIAGAFLDRAVRGPDLGLSAQATCARLRWHQGDVSGAIDQLEEAVQRKDAKLRERLMAEKEILQGWVPVLEPVNGYVPAATSVLHLLTNSLPHTGSGYAQRSHSVLKAQQDAGWRVLAATRIGYPVQVGKVLAAGEDVVDGVRYARIIPRGLAATQTGRLQQEAEALLQLALRFRPSVLHTTTHYVNALVVEAVAGALGIPWVYEVRGQLADTWASTRGPEALQSERYTLFQQREAAVMRRAALVVTLGEAMKERILGAGVDPARVLLTPNAVGEDYLQVPPTAGQARQELGLSEAFTVGTVSSLVPYEGLETLMEAFALVADQCPGMRLLVVGDGTALPALKAQVSGLGLDQRVTFTGRVPRHTARLHHCALDVFVVPRVDVAVTRAVTPLKPVEAMACARPVVASDLPALREIVQDGKTGELVAASDPAPLAETLKRWYRDPESAQSLGRNGRDVVLSTRTWAANAAVLNAAYIAVTREVDDGQGDRSGDGQGDGPAGDAAVRGGVGGNNQ